MQDKVEREKPWTKTEIKRLAGYLARNESLAVCASKLGRSKNSVIGKVHRLGLRPTIVSQKKSRKGIRYSDKLIGSPKDGCCRWHSDETGWCQEEAMFGYPYCSAHYERSVARPQPPLNVDDLVKID